MSSAPATTVASRWPHRMAMFMAIATFPLIFVGGLVTTYEAGMAVPDWPTTFGYNLFLYPWQTWIYGPWNLFIEHGHRLLGALVGMLAIALVVVLQLREERRWVRLLGYVGLFGVIAQGVLGGMRVLLDQRTLAQIHGCTGPLFFALAVSLVAVTSAWWRQGSALWREGAAGESRSEQLVSRSAEPDRLQVLQVRILATFCTIAAYGQIILGSQIRHLPLGLSPVTFQSRVWMHLIMAGVLTLGIVALLVAVERSCRRVPKVRHAAWLLTTLLLLQATLGIKTWLLKYGVPDWFADAAWAQRFLIVQGSMMQALTTTAHVAIGSLLMVVSLQLALRSWRLLPSGGSVGLRNVALRSEALSGALPGAALREATR